MLEIRKGPRLAFTGSAPLPIVLFGVALESRTRCQSTLSLNTYSERIADRAFHFRDCG